ncbi:MAG: DNA photolyase [Desulfobacterales bacterium]|nr:DNA photolyase [Desulfobacterales bacterium]
MSKIYIDHQVSDAPEVISILSRLNLPAEIVRKSDEVFGLISASADPVQEGKTVLYLTRNKGPFIRKCPGTRHYRCCDYKILHVGTFCSMDCAYCILQTYFHPPVLQYFVNKKDLQNEINVLFSENKIQRIGTGEFTDSLIWEKLIDLSGFLVPAFAGQDTAVLELKTKTTHIDGLEKLVHNRKTIIAWSLNTPEIIATEERGTTSLAERLQAAAKCASWGYPLAFHFDPLILYDGCENEYRQVVEQLFTQVSGDQIAWISLGTFRFIPGLKPIVQRRFPKSKIVYGEFVTGLDNKMRYFKPLRIRLYQMMASWIKAFAPDVLIYFCMEDDEVWERALGFVPKAKGGLPRMLDESAARHCDLKT